MPKTPSPSVAITLLSRCHPLEWPADGMLRSIFHRDLAAFKASLATGGPWLASEHLRRHDSTLTPLMWTIDAGWPEAFELMADSGAGLQEPGDLDHAHGGLTPFLLAAYRDEVKIGEALLARGADAFAVDGQGLRAMALASMAGSCAFIRMLHSRGHKVDVPSVHRVPALALAADHLSTEAVATLLELGADLDSRHGVGRAALHIVASKACPVSHRILLALLASGANFEIEDHSGSTPLIRAALANSPMAVHALLSAGACPRRIAGRGTSAMAIAESRRGEPAADLLLAWREAEALRDGLYSGAARVGRPLAL